MGCWWLNIRTLKPTAYCSSSTIPTPGPELSPHPVSSISTTGSGIFTALTDAGLTVTTLEEHREVPWNPLGEAMIPSPDFDGEFILANDRDRIPLTYTVEAAKR